MHAWPVTFPEFTNREDLKCTISLFDDDTGQAVDLLGVTRAAAGDFTGSSWIVSSGGVATTSSSTLTIKDYPVSDEMQSISLLVGAGLSFAPGDSVTIRDVPGLNSMIGEIISYAPATGALVCRVGCAFVFEIHQNNCGDHDLSPWSAPPSTDVIRATLGDGITIIGDGTLQILLPVSAIGKLRHRTCKASMAAYCFGETRQLFVGTVPIISGGVSVSSQGW